MKRRRRSHRKRNRQRLASHARRLRRCTTKARGWQRSRAHCPKVGLVKTSLEGFDPQADPWRDT